jgi:ABC-type transporter Mla subunit MlaD
MRRNQGAIAANPILIGAVTVLVTVVAVFLAYQANEGLPFVTTRSLTVDMPNAQNLVEQNEVREGGHRIGLVTKMEPVRLATGRIGARLFVELDGNVPAVPVDSTWAVRPRSALSLKYLELVRGESRKVVPNEGHVGIERANNPVELDQLLKIFDHRTRNGQRKTFRYGAEALYGRGADINTSIHELPPFLDHLEPVARTLAEPSTGLRTFFRELGDTARIVAPIGEQYAESFTDGATTFEAISRDERALEDTIEKTPPTLAVGRRALHNQQPFLRDLAAYSEDLETSAREVRRALPPVNRALAVGTPVQRASIPLSDRTRDTLIALSELTREPTTLVGLRALTATTQTLNPQLRYLGPKITVCNNWNYFWTFASEHLSERDPTGTAQRTITLDSDRQDNSYSTMGAVTPANGEHVQPDGIPQFFHGQAYGHAVDEQGNADCEDGQRGWPKELANKFATPEIAQRFSRVVGVPRSPGNQGPLFKQIVKGEGVGRTLSRVPPGQTWASEPETGAGLP